jgi:hypothetical protein
MANPNYSYGNNSRDYQKRSGYQQVHLHFHAAPTQQQAQPPQQPATLSASLPSAAEINRQCALIAKTIVTIIATMWVTMIPYMAIPFAGIAILYYIQVRQSKRAAIAATNAANNETTTQQLALTGANATSMLPNAPANRLGVPSKRLARPFLRLPQPLKRLAAPLKRLPRPLKRLPY